MRIEGIGHLQDQYVDGTKGFVRDICPFTTMGLFNRGHTDAKRKTIATELGKLLGVEEAVPDSFDGIPLLNLQSSWFFPFEKDREPDHINALWNVFEAAIKFADSDDDGARAEFAKAFDAANGRCIRRVEAHLWPILDSTVVIPDPRQELSGLRHEEARNSHWSARSQEKV